MFLHSENKELLWKTLQKSPYLLEFTQKYAGYREVWFQGTMETFFTQWISQNNMVPTNARELLNINKCALQFIIADIKRLLGYSASSQQMGKIIATNSSPTTGSVAALNDLPSYQSTVAAINDLPSYQTTVAALNDLPSYQSTVAALNDLPSYQTTVAALNDLPSYNVSEERQRREDQWSSNFSKYQTEYNNLLKRPELPIGELPTNTVDEKIKNIDELVKEHARIREIDLNIYSNAQTSQQPNQKLKIMDELERIDISIVVPETPTNAKSVHWSENLSESQ